MSGRNRVLLLILLALGLSGLGAAKLLEPRDHVGITPISRSRSIEIASPAPRGRSWKWVGLVELYQPILGVDPFRVRAFVVIDRALPVPRRVRVTVQLTGIVRADDGDATVVLEDRTDGTVALLRRGDRIGSELQVAEILSRSIAIGPSHTEPAGVAVRNFSYGESIDLPLGAIALKSYKFSD